jgi:hypothetical protein
MHAAVDPGEHAEQPPVALAKKPTAHDEQLDEPAARLTCPVDDNARTPSAMLMREK